MRREPGQQRDDLLAQSDVLSIHLVLSPRSRGLIGARELGLMKPTAYLVNTSRGPIVDEPALVRALQNGRIAGAGSTCSTRNPYPRSSPATAGQHGAHPHIGYVTAETYHIFFDQTVENIRAFLDGQPVRTLNTPRPKP